MKLRKNYLMKDFDVRVVSFPSWELFEKQDEAYRESVLPKNITARLAVEAGATLGWERYAKSMIGIDHYGASAPYKVIFENFGFTVENVVAKAKELDLRSSDFSQSDLSVGSIAEVVTDRQENYESCCWV